MEHKELRCNRMLLAGDQENQCSNVNPVVTRLENDGCWAATLTAVFDVLETFVRER